MSVTTKAIEVAGMVDQHHHLVLDEPLPIDGPARVRVIVFVADNSDDDEEAWLRAAARNPAFAYLNDPAEDVYTLRDGTAIYEA